MAGYIGNIPVPQALRNYDVFTATSGQTVFNVKSYDPSFIDVYQNGVKLIDGDDYTATDGNTVVLASGATLNDIVEVISFTTFYPADVVSASAGGTFADDVTVSGDFTITGSLSKGSGSFKIDHPIKPDTHHLVHSFIEGPQADNIYRGRVTLVDGAATVNLDESGRMTEGTFIALNSNVQCFMTNEDGWTAVRGRVDGNILTIEAQDEICKDTVSWLVIGERRDQHMIDADWTDESGRIITEPEKKFG